MADRRQNLQITVSLCFVFSTMYGRRLIEIQIEVHRAPQWHGLLPHHHFLCLGRQLPVNTPQLVPRLIIPNLEHLGWIVSSPFFGMFLTFPGKITALAAHHHRYLADPWQDQQRLRFQCFPVFCRQRKRHKSQKIIAPDPANLHPDTAYTSALILCLDLRCLFAACQCCIKPGLLILLSHRQLSLYLHSHPAANRESPGSHMQHYRRFLSLLHHRDRQFHTNTRMTHRRNQCQQQKNRKCKFDIKQH